MYLKAVALWHALSSAEKQAWESSARRKHMTGFAWFMSQALKPNPGLYLPLQGGIMSGDIDMDKHRILKLPLPTDDQEAASKKYHDDNLPPGYTDADAIAAAKTIKLDDFATPDDNTDLDFSTARHGLVPKGPDLGKFLKDDGTWAVVAVVGIPSGGIIIWHGTIANIPAGFVICDGNNSTPNLLTRFVQGVATAATDPGATGGATAKTTSGHQHDIPISRYSGNTILTKHNAFGSGANYIPATALTGEGDVSSRAAALTKSNTDGITDIRPKFYDVAFIMKT